MALVAVQNFYKLSKIFYGCPTLGRRLAYLIIRKNDIARKVSRISNSTLTKEKRIQLLSKSSISCVWVTWPPKVAKLATIRYWIIRYLFFFWTQLNDSSVGGGTIFSARNCLCVSKGTSSLSVFPSMKASWMEANSSATSVCKFVNSQAEKLTPKQKNFDIIISPKYWKQRADTR